MSKLDRIPMDQKECSMSANSLLSTLIHINGVIGGNSEVIFLQLKLKDEKDLHQMNLVEMRGMHLFQQEV